MSTDRELLERAAWAAGIEIGPEDFTDEIGRKYCDGLGLWVLSIAGRPDLGGQWFNPLNYNDDALRLAVKLRVHIEWAFTHPGKPEQVQASPKGYGHCADVQMLESDPYAATRRAIVRAAAALGEQQ
jgi:hypothetical protein